MCHNLIADASLYRRALEADRAIAEGAREEPCRFCEGVLHRGDYMRRPRGAPPAVEDEEFCRRFSFCCAECRRRTTPPSLRFLGRKVYLGAVVVLLAAAGHGLTAKRLRKLRVMFAVELSRQTVKRWLSWWRRDFVKSPFWKSARGRLRRPVKAADLPAALLDAFTGSGRRRLLSLLAFLGPITSATARGSMAI